MTGVRTSLALALLALGGCGADVQVDRVCVTSPGYVLATAPLPIDSAPLPTIQLTFSMGSAVPDPSQQGVHDVHVLFRTLDLASTQSAAFVTTLTVSAVPPAGSALPKLLLGTYQRPASGAGTTVEVTGAGADLFPYVRSGRLVLELGGELDPRLAPNGTFTADARVCAEAQGSVTYL